jgi:hypothetical protein
MRGKLFGVLGFIGILILVLPFAGAAQSKPINLALFNPVQIFPENNPIGGVRINLLYGKNISMVGFDWGLVNAVGTGGCQGVQWGLVNLCEGNFVGWQSGLLNLSNKNVEGFQYGWYNTGDYVSGFQLGLVNSAQTMKGLQIGIVNIIKTGGQFPVFPIVNWSF